MGLMIKVSLVKRVIEINISVWTSVISLNSQVCCKNLNGSKTFKRASVRLYGNLFIGPLR